MHSDMVAIYNSMIIALSNVLFKTFLILSNSLKAPKVS